MVRVRTFLVGLALLATANAVAQVPGSGQLSLPILGSTPEVDRLERRLASRVNLTSSDTTLDGFAGQLRQSYGLNVFIDHRALDDVGLKSTASVPAVDLKNVVLEEGINLILEQLDMAFIVRDATLVITTPEESEDHLEHRVYPVADLVRVTPMDARRRSPWNADYDTLIDTITSVIAPDTWDQVGGAGSIEPFPNCYALVIGQERRVHRQVQALLTTLRRSRILQGIPAPGVPLSVPQIGSQPYRSPRGVGGRGPAGDPIPRSSEGPSLGGFF